jgi:Carbohydrate binding domain
LPRARLPIAAAVVALIFVVLISGASGEELLVNGGFETGDTQGWSVAGNELQISTVAHSGGYAGQLTSDGLEQNMTIHQSVLVQPARKYQLVGWILQNDPAVTQVMLEINWFDRDDNLVLISQSQQLTGTDAAYRELATGELTPPLGAAWARASVSVAGSGVFSVYVDDVSFAGVDPPVPTDTPVPTQDTPTPNDSVSATPIVTLTGSVSPTPTGSPAISPTPTSAISASPARTPTASPTRTPSPTPAPRTPVPTPAEPRVFQRLTNTGFEDLRGDGTPYAWRKIGGTLGTSSRAHSGQRSLSLISGTASTKWAYQIVGVQAGAYYQGAAYAMQDNATAGQVFLRVSWYGTDDGSGEAIATDDSTQTISQNVNGFAPLQTDPLEAPAGARTAAIRLMFRPGDSGESTALFDEASFAEIEPPTDRPATQKPTPSPAPSASSPTPTPTGTPVQTNTPSPTHTSAPLPTPSPATSAPELAVFPSLVNGGFETAREDGTPYGWHKVGGGIAVTDQERIEGDLALAISSQTSSTKWAYEAISVTPGAYYAAEAWAMNTAVGDTLLLRFSWYVSEDTSGSAIDSADSLSTVSGDSIGFRQLSTGPVQAPANARSVRVRLLLEPASAAPTRAFFDAVSFGETAGPDSADPNGVVQSASASRRDAARLTDGAAPSATTDVPSPTVLDARATPAILANVRPPDQDLAQLGQSVGGSSMPWLPLAIAVPTAAIGGFVAAEAVRMHRRRARPGG